LIISITDLRKARKLPPHYGSNFIFLMGGHGKKECFHAEKKIGEKLNWKSHDFMHQLDMPCKRTEDPTEVFLIIQGPFSLLPSKVGIKNKLKQNVPTNDLLIGIRT
jgi:hypothetical protein